MVRSPFLSLLRFGLLPLRFPLLLPLSEFPLPLLTLIESENVRHDTLAQVPLLPEEKAETRRRREMSYLNLRWFMQTLLDRMDRTSMAWGLEARVPFADHRIVEYVYNVPWSMKYENGMEGSTAQLLRQELSNHPSGRKP